MTGKGVIGISATILVVLAAGAVLGYHLIVRSFPKTSGTVSVHGISREVQIKRDRFGVPHISAASESDAFFAVGYTHAQDRLWQMDLLRRAGSGRLSEVLGPRALPIDKMFRTIGFHQLSRRLEQSLDDETRKALQAYADGVNQFIDAHRGNYPVEFDMLNIDPEPWTVEHSLIVGRLMAWEMNFSRWNDLLLLELIQRFGEEKAKEIFPYWPDDAPCIITKDPKGKNVGEALRPLFDADGAYRSLLGLPALESGSNAWAVGGAKSVTGKPVLANDPHLLLMVPGRWYEIHFSCPGLDVAGMSVVGMPFVIAGRNAKIAWGVTNAMLDDEDFYIEEVDSLQHPTRYKFNGEWKPIQETIDTIFVKDDLPVVISIYSTHRGPIVNKMEPSAQTLSSLVSMRWTGYELTDEAGAFYRMNKAGTWNEFQDALRLFGAPAQNFVYADVDGNIGYRTGGKIPLRTAVVAKIPSSGSTGESDWKGFVPFEQMPVSFNPPEGFIATANNKIIGESFPYHISSHWESPWRAERIVGVLREQSRFTVEDHERLQNDLFSLQAREIVPYILHAFDSVSVTRPDVKTMLEYFRNWNCEMRSEDVGTTLFQATLTQMVYRTFHDKMGDRLYGLYDTIASTPLSALSRLLKNPDSAWFDDDRTTVHETRDDLIRRSVDGALVELHDKLGGELKEWQWGRLHQVTFRHIFDGNALLKGIFDIGPFPIGGSHATVNVGQYFLAHSYESAVGPSMRQIFNLADINDTRTVLPPGQSGQVFSNHYKDQITLWQHGAYKIRAMEQSAVDASCDEELVLRPIL